MTDSETLSPMARSVDLFELAQSRIPGGVNSPVRAFNAVGGTPRFMQRGAGPYLWDVDGNQYVDYVMSWGPLIHGHAFEPVVQAVAQAAASGTSFGAPTSGEVELAGLVIAAFPSIEMVRFVSSGTEATMSALRLARACTGRDIIVKFAGNYHGHADSLLAQAGSGSLTLGVPSSPGVPRSITSSTLVAPYNDPQRLEQIFFQRSEDIAAVIVEPIAGNMGVVPPQEGFLETIRRLTTDAGALLIADEIISGFRVAYGGAQELLHMQPDITTLGKILGAGLPVGAFGGRRAIMEYLAPTGPVYQAGTLSGNPLAMAAGIANLRALEGAPFYSRLGAATERLAGGLRVAAEEAGIPVTVNAVTGMLTLFFTEGPVTTLEAATASNTDLYARFFHGMLNRGFYLPPSQFEAWMLSSLHTDAIIDRTLEMVRSVLQELAGE